MCFEVPVEVSLGVCINLYFTVSHPPFPSSGNFFFLFPQHHKLNCHHILLNSFLYVPCHLLSLICVLPDVFFFFFSYLFSSCYKSSCCSFTSWLHKPSIPLPVLFSVSCSVQLVACLPQSLHLHLCLPWPCPPHLPPPPRSPLLFLLPPGFQSSRGRELSSTRGSLK